MAHFFHFGLVKNYQAVAEDFSPQEDWAMMEKQTHKAARLSIIKFSL